MEEKEDWRGQKACAENAGLFVPAYFLKSLLAFGVDEYPLNFLYEHSKRAVESALKLCAQRSAVSYWDIEEPVRLEMFEFHRLLRAQVPLMGKVNLPRHVVSAAWKNTVLDYGQVERLALQAFGVDSKLEAKKGTAPSGPKP